MTHLLHNALITGGRRATLESRDRLHTASANSRLPTFAFVHMVHLPKTASDSDLISFVDDWARLMDAEDYMGAFAFTSHVPYMRWTPTLLEQAVKSYDECKPSQKVTVEGKPTDVAQHKEVMRWPEPRPGGIGLIWYDLNIDGSASDLTATFAILDGPEGLTIQLEEISVM